MDKREIAAEIRKATAGDADAQERTLSSLARLLIELSAKEGFIVSATDFVVSWKDSELVIHGSSDQGKCAVAVLGRYLKGTAHTHKCPECSQEYECRGGGTAGPDGPEGPCAGTREVTCAYCFSTFAD